MKVQTLINKLKKLNPEATLYYKKDDYPHNTNQLRIQKNLRVSSGTYKGNDKEYYILF